MELYYYPGSPPSRSILMLVKILGLDVNLKFLDLMAREQYEESYIEMNPLHSVPFLTDEDLKISESRAILIYLVEAYGREAGLYPEEPKARALVNQRLFFDAGTLAQRFGECYLWPVFMSQSLPRDELAPRVAEAFSVLNSYLDGQEWAAGPNMTIADIALVATVSTAEGCGYDLSNYENITSWLSRCKEQIEGYEETNQSGLDALVEYYNSKLAELSS